MDSQQQNMAHIAQILKQMAETLKQHNDKLGEIERLSQQASTSARIAAFGERHD
jgi:hypothetical protein